jgi:hypothetical protein
MDIIQTLYEYDIMTPTLLDVLDYSLPPPYETQLPRIPLPSGYRRPKQNPNSNSNSSGFFSALSSFLLAGPQEEDDLRARKYVPSEEERDAERACMEVVLELRLDRLLLEKSSYLTDLSFKSLITGLCRGSVFGYVLAGDGAVDKWTRTDMEHAIFLIDVITKVFEWNPKRISLVYPVVKLIIFDTVLKQPSKWHYLLIKRAVVSWFRIAELLVSEPSALLDKHLISLGEIEQCLLAISPDPVPGKKDESTMATSNQNLTSVLPGRVSYLQHLAPACLASLHHLIAHILEKQGRERGAQTLLVVFWHSIVVLIVSGSQHCQLPQETLSTKAPAAPLIPPGSQWAWECFLQVAALLGINARGEFVPDPLAAPLNAAMYLDLVEIVNAFIRSAALSIAAQGESTISASSIASKLASATRDRQKTTDGAIKEDESLSASTSVSRPSVLSSSVERGLASLKLLYFMYDRISDVVDESHPWNSLWLPTVISLGEHTYHPAREIRQHSFTYIQRVLLSSELMDSTAQNVDSEELIRMVFESVLFPLMDTLLVADLANLEHLVRPDSSRSPNEKPVLDLSLSITRGASIDEIRSRACGLLCKLFLHFIPHFDDRVAPELVEDVWLKILSVLERYYHGGRESSMDQSVPSQVDVVESIPESLKNMLLVMSTSGIFGSHNDNRLWDLTWVKLDKWLPGTRQELFPDLAARPHTSEPEQVQ